MKYNSTIVFFLHTTVSSFICGYGSIDMRWRVIARTVVLVWILRS